MIIKSLANTNINELFNAFQQAFADYELQLNKNELSAMLKRRGFDPLLSFGAFDGEKLVSFTCSGVGHFYETPTAYDTGTGTLKDYRGRGLATQIFEYSLPHLKEVGIKNYLLEVLQHNTSAVSVYQKIGFKEQREFYYFKSENNLSAFTIRPIDISKYTNIPSFWDFEPSWQNSILSVNRSPDSFIYFGVFWAPHLWDMEFSNLNRETLLRSLSINDIAAKALAHYSFLK